MICVKVPDTRNPEFWENESTRRIQNELRRIEEVVADMIELASGLEDILKKRKKKSRVDDEDKK